MKWIRTCQECGNDQEDKEPVGQMTDAYANRKCKECNSMALDYGSYESEDEDDDWADDFENEDMNEDEEDTLG